MTEIKDLDFWARGTIAITSGRERERERGREGGKEGNLPDNKMVFTKFKKSTK